MVKKKVKTTGVIEMRNLITPSDQEVPVSRQCELLGIPLSTYYYKPLRTTHEEDELCRLIDIIYTDFPYYGSRRIAHTLKQECMPIGRKRTSSLMKKMKIEAIYQKPRTSIPNPEHKVYPYLLKNIDINKPNQVWCTDITYIKLSTGWTYLMAVMDWRSRRVISWGVSNTMGADFCVRILEESLKHGKPEIFNTDQGSQYTSESFTAVLKREGIKISMDGKGRYLDNILIERLWRSVKYENIYINDYRTIGELRLGLTLYFDKYNHRRIHQSLDYKTPDDVWSFVA